MPHTESEKLTGWKTEFIDDFDMKWVVGCMSQAVVIIANSLA